MRVYDQQCAAQQLSEIFVQRIGEWDRFCVLYEIPVSNMHLHLNQFRDFM